ncbi:MAG: SusD/RagB family nutrient-binding outer membrane lipoprotein [Microbacter sp.]
MKKINIVIVLFILLALSSCTANFDSINTSPTALSKVSPNLLFFPMKGVSEADYQRNYSLYDDFYAEYFSDVTFFTSSRYVYVDGWADTGWTEFYDTYLPDYYGIVNNSKSNSFKNMRAIAQIWICYAWQRMTDRWGDIPYTNAGEGKAVPYESQKSIYESLLQRVKAASDSIDVNDASQYNPGSYDFLYHGDYSKWKKFGYSLLLRMALRISNVDASFAKPYAQAAINSGVFSSNSDNAWVNQDINAWYDYYNNIDIAWQNVAIAKKLVDVCSTASSVGIDPRLPMWCIPGTNSNWQGFPSGISQSDVPSNYQWSNYAQINMNSYFKPGRIGGAGTGLSYPVMTYSEVLFLEAEAAMRGWFSANYNSLYLSAINASMQEVGVSLSDATAYLSGVPGLTGANESSFQALMTQKWLALFPNGVEAWAEIRRTGYPLTTADYVSVSPNATVTNGNWIGRLRYVNNEHDNNASNLPANYNTYSNDRMDKCVWWGQQNSSGVFPITMTPKNF